MKMLRKLWRTNRNRKKYPTVNKMIKDNGEAHRQIGTEAIVYLPFNANKTKTLKIIREEKNKPWQNQV